MKTLRTNPSLRLRPPSELTNKKWQVEDFNVRKIFSIPSIAVCLLLYAIKPKNADQLAKDFITNFNISNDAAAKLIEDLNKKNLILNDTHQANGISNHDLFLESYHKWKLYNWDKAAEYHFFTYNYPFLDYADNADGWQITNQRMQDYSEDKADINRFKSYSDDFERAALPEAINKDKTDLNNLKISSNDKIDINAVSIVTTMAFTKTAEMSIRWKGAPLLRRTSPSGGSRHPTEGYLVALDVQGIDSALYHIQTEPFFLVKITNINKSEISKLFNLKKNDNHCAAIIMLTSVFERNMYRYREPRTFRTIHMDVGHIIGTIELTSNHSNIETKIINNFNKTAIENLLGLDSLKEGLIASVGLYNKGHLS
jgi:SagB-type dehydrogenase family enzyme